MLTPIILCICLLMTAFSPSFDNDDKSTLTVVILPEAAANEGARWRINDGQGSFVSDWKRSGDTLQDSKLTDGDHKIEFQSISGWQTPADQVIFIRPGRPHQREGEYRK